MQFTRAEVESLNRRERVYDGLIYVSETDDDGGLWYSADALDRQYRTREEAYSALRELTS